MNNDKTNDEENLIEPYNYCDYWCEKCTDQEKCVIYNEDLQTDDEEIDLLRLIEGSTFENTLDMIHRYVKKNNIDISEFLDFLSDEDDEGDDDYGDYGDDDDDVDDDDDDAYDDYENDGDGDDAFDGANTGDGEDNENEEDSIHAQIIRQIEESPLQSLCLIFLEKTAEFIIHYRRRYIIPEQLSEAFSIISWYRTILPVKMERTLHSLYEFGFKEELFPLKDAFLTSLVVYKSIRKSLSAIEDLKAYLIDYQEMLTELEDILVFIKNGLIHEFPFWIILWLLCSDSSSPCIVEINIKN